MTVQVIRKFKDKYSGVIHEIGDILQVTEERAAEMTEGAQGALVQEIEDQAKKEAEKEENKETEKDKAKTKNKKSGSDE